MTATVEMTWNDSPAAASHAWMPSSPCDSGCVGPDRAEVGDLQFAARVVGVGALLLSFPAVSAVAPRPWKNSVQRRYAHALLRCCGILLQVVDDRGEASPGAMYAKPGDGLLIVAGHVGWTDILVLGAVQPVSFVARGDLIDWPVLGRLARKMRVIPIDRGSLKGLPGVIRQISDRIAAGERIAAFPEGTTWCGRAYGSLRPALFQSAIDTQTAVQPVRLTYREANGDLSTAPSFVGEDTMAASLLRMLRSSGITAEVVLARIEQPGTDRRDLAARCERAVRGEVHLEFADHGVLESAAARNTTNAKAVEAQFGSETESSARIA